MRLLLTYAVQEELPAIRMEGIELTAVEVGIGKVSAAHRLTRAICETQPDAVLNIGTVGTLVHRVGEMFLCRRFVDRDLQKLGALGIEYRIACGEFPQLERFPFSVLPEGVCNTGDSFLTEVADVEGDVVDMEGFAQAAVCQAMGVPFLAVKYVTDIIGQNSVKAWKEKLSDARTALSKLLSD